MSLQFPHFLFVTTYFSFWHFGSQVTSLSTYLEQQSRNSLIIIAIGKPFPPKPSMRSIINIFEFNHPIIQRT